MKMCDCGVPSCDNGMYVDGLNCNDDGSIDIVVFWGDNKERRVTIKEEDINSFIWAIETARDRAKATKIERKA